MALIFAPVFLQRQLAICAVGLHTCHSELPSEESRTAVKAFVPQLHTRVLDPSNRPSEELPQDDTRSYAAGCGCAIQ